MIQQLIVFACAVDTFFYIFFFFTTIQADGWIGAEK